MRILSFIREFWTRHGRSILRYGIGALLFISALVMGKMAAAFLLLAGVLVMYAAERWGEPYRLRGQGHFEQRRLERRHQTQNLLDAVRGWLQRGGEPPPPQKQKLGDEEEAEFGGFFVHEPERDPPKPPVTHET